MFSDIWVCSSSATKTYWLFLLLNRPTVSTMTLLGKCSQKKSYPSDSLVLTTQNRTHQHLRLQRLNVTYPFTSMKTSAAPDTMQIQDIQVQTSKSSIKPALGSTSNLCRLQYLKELVMAVVENTQRILQQREMQQANLQGAVQARHQLLTPCLAVIPQTWGPDHFGLVWIYQKQSELLSKVWSVWFSWTLMDKWTVCPILLRQLNFFPLQRHVAGYRQVQSSVCGQQRENLQRNMFFSLRWATLHTYMNVWFAW